jgi:hypothetical protein
MIRMVLLPKYIQYFIGEGIRIVLETETIWRSGMLIHFAWGMGKVKLNSTKMSKCNSRFLFASRKSGKQKRRGQFEKQAY